MTLATAEQEQHRHRCEVRTLLRSIREPGKGRAWVQQYLDDPRVAGRREALRADLNEQRKRGNKGETGQWL